MKRRTFLANALIGTSALALFGWYAKSGTNPAQAAQGTFEITKTPDEWRAILTDMQYAVLREEATERPFTSPLNDEKRAGIFHCAGCDLELYSSAHKFDSGTGWPSFYQSLENAVGTSTDYKLIYPRTEVHCRRCGGHLGHVFNDGPLPTGKRHCINGVAMTFKPEEKQAG